MQGTNSCRYTVIFVQGTNNVRYSVMSVQGTNSVRYSVKGWRHLAHCMGRTNLATELLRKTSRSVILFFIKSMVAKIIGLTGKLKVLGKN